MRAALEQARTHDRSSRAGPSRPHQCTSRIAKPRSQAPGRRFLAGEWTEEALLRRARRAVTPAPRWLRRSSRTRSPRTTDRPPIARASWRRTSGSRSSAARGRAARAAARAAVAPIRGSAGSGAAGRCRPIDTTADLGALLEPRRRAGSTGSPTRAAWSAPSPTERLRNYRYVWLPRRGGPPRLIERPKRPAEGGPAARAARDARPDPGARRGHGFVARPLGRSPTPRATPAERGRAASTSRTSSRRSTAGARVRHLPHRRLPGGGGARADRRSCTNVVPRAEWAARAAPAGPRRSGGRPPPARPQARDASPPAGRSHLARAREPGRLPASTAASRASPPRSAPATRATPTTSRSPATRGCCAARGPDRAPPWRRSPRDEGFR